MKLRGSWGAWEYLIMWGTNNVKTDYVRKFLK